jgi:hypothetical protein
LSIETFKEMIKVLIENHLGENFILKIKKGKFIKIKN